MMARPNMVLVPVIFALLGGGVSAALANHNPGYYFDMRARVVHTDATAVSYPNV